MKAIAKLYLKIFLLAGVSYGLVMLAFNWANGTPFDIWRFLFSTLFFGMAMSLLLVSLHKYRIKQKGIQEITQDDLKLFHSKRFKTSLTQIELLEKLKSDPIIAQMKVTEIENGIQLSSGMSLYSWGEKITLLLKSEGFGAYEYEVTSSPKLKVTLLDYGKNLENVKRIENLILGVGELSGTKG